jgi:glutaminyl-peptide cyclotransferase
MRSLIVLTACVACACGPASQAEVPQYGFDVVHVYPHDRAAFTEGLFYLNGFLYEATGLKGSSSVRKVRLETGEVLQQTDLPEAYFGEGIVKWKDKLYQMTYTTEVSFIYDFTTLHKTGEFHYKGQGWAFTTDGKQIYMDGSHAVNAEASDPEIRIWDPETLNETESSTSPTKAGRWTT